jgi:hypothetical protein
MGDEPENQTVIHPSAFIIHPIPQILTQMNDED